MRNDENFFKEAFAEIPLFIKVMWGVGAILSLAMTVAFIFLIIAVIQALGSAT